MKRLRIALVAAAPFAGLAVLSAVAVTGEHIIAIEERELPDRITVDAGKTLVIVNQDEVFHSLYSATPGYEFNLGTQLPGQTKTVDLPKAGELDVQCWIHPAIRMRVDVADRTAEGAAAEEADHDR